jgi:hypothetical protein
MSDETEMKKNTYPECLPTPRRGLFFQRPQRVRSVHGAPGTWKALRRCRAMRPLQRRSDELQLSQAGTSTMFVYLSCYLSMLTYMLQVTQFTRTSYV